MTAHHTVVHPSAGSMEGGQRGDEADGGHGADESPSGASGPRIKAYSPSKAGPGTAHSSSGNGTGPEDGRGSAAPADAPQVRLVRCLCLASNHLVRVIGAWKLHSERALHVCVLTQILQTGCRVLTWWQSAHVPQPVNWRCRVPPADGAVAVRGEHRHREAAEGPAE